MKGGQVSPEATMALNEMRQRTSAQEYGRFILEALKSTGLVGRPFNETPIGQAAALRGQPLEQQLAVNENDPAFGFAGTTVGKGIKAFHSSPHSFEKFDLGKIGTGEGAQAYGHGLYMADSPGVSGRGGAYDQTFTARNLGKHDLTAQEAAILREMKPDASDMDIFRALIRDGRIATKADGTPDIEQASEAISRIREAKSNIYEVNINASPDQFLDWDKPIGQQPPEAVKALREGYKKTFGVSDRYLDDTLHPGATIRDAIGAGRVSKPMTDNLSELGVPGIKYLDQGSRATGDGSRNYVVFDPNIVQILRKYGMLPPTVLAGTLGYGNSESQ